MNIEFEGILASPSRAGRAGQSAQAAFGVRLAAYRFDRYLTLPKAARTRSVAAVYFRVSDEVAARDAFRPLSTVADAIYFARDVGSEPGNILTPRELARRIQALARPGLDVAILGERRMRELDMGALLCVGQGSPEESQLVVMQWHGAGAAQAPIAFAGKGICFDSGGLSLKASENMGLMKWDMAGAGTIAGLMSVLASRNAEVNAVAALALAENMPDGKAFRPGDIVRSMSGQTIEIISTDAEGRLVLADALWYLQQRFRPHTLIDVATLTGATEIALGKRYAGCYSNDDELAGALVRASVAESEPLWQMPLVADYLEDMESSVADLKNLGKRAGGAISAATFLERFVNGVPWAHLDIAGVTWCKPSRNPTLPEGVRGYGIRLLNRFIADHCERKSGESSGTGAQSTS